MLGRDTLTLALKHVSILNASPSNETNYVRNKWPGDRECVGRQGKDEFHIIASTMRGIVRHCKAIKVASKSTAATCSNVGFPSR